MEKEEKEIFERLYKELKKHAINEGFKLNSNKRIVDALINGLMKNKKEKGEHFCPCRIRHTKKEICPCAHHKKEIKEKGKCLCGLFVGK